MKAIVQYQAEDGHIFNSAENAERRDKMIRDVRAALSPLSPTPKECNWEGYVQQSAEAVRRVRENLFAIANQPGVLAWWIEQQNALGNSNDKLTHTTHPTWFGRMLDGGHEPLSRAYSRLCCIDDQFREWNQPYFAMNPSEGKNIRRN